MKNRDKIIKKMKKKSLISPILFFLFLILFGSMVIAITAASLMFLTASSHYKSAQRATEGIIRTIEVGLAQGSTYDTILLEAEKVDKRVVPISVMDSSGNIVSHYGDVFSPEDVSEVYDATKPLSLQFSLDQADDLDPDEDMLVCIALDNILKDCLKSYRENRENDIYIFLEEEIFEYSFWLEYRPTVGEATFYIRQDIILTAEDCVMILVPTVMILFVFLVLCIIHLINGIVRINTQGYYLKLLLSDPVTGEFNELAFEHFTYHNLRSRINKKKGFAIVDLSLAKYQNFCTLYGVEEGEALLTQFAKSIKKSLSRGEVVARVAGGDFLILLKTKETQAGDVLLLKRTENLIKDLPGKLETALKGHEIERGAGSIKTRVGVYYIPPISDDETQEKRDKHLLNVKDLCIKAGIAKQSLAEDYGVKMYSHAMWEKEIWEQKVENMMADALLAEEFQVYIQPKYHPSTEKLMGGEALVRWISPTEGFISPGQFIPIFERTGFVTKLDDYMISHTAKLQSEWLQAGKEIVPISVNVSRVHFAQPDLAEHIRDLVDQYPLPHQYIEIELTESAFFDDKKMLLQTVHKLQEYGFEVSMDDFGSGYSSLNSLKDLPLNVLKLDAEFFRGEEFDRRGEIVVSEAIALAKQLNMKIVAEGVEKKEQVDFLASQNCDMIQGYYFAKPMPASEYESRMS